MNIFYHQKPLLSSAYNRADPCKNKEKRNGGFYMGNRAKKNERASPLEGRWALAAKRALDLVGSVLLIAVTLPIMLFAAFGVRVSSPGPIIFSQERVGFRGRVFRMHKFRTMRENSTPNAWTTPRDPRKTKFGTFLRRTAIDELPQLFNILKGDMTIVGPRPERPEIARQYEQVLPEFGLRLQVKAGLTGFAQVYGRYNTEPRDKLQMDLMYINRMSLAQDLKLIFATVKILFLRESTSGTAEGQTTAMAENKDTTTV